MSYEELPIRLRLSKAFTKLVD